MADVEDSHWWFKERRTMLRSAIRSLRPGTALDIGAAGGGNTRVLQAAGWHAVALEYGEQGAQVASERGLPVLRGDAHHLPVRDASVDLVVAFDVIEHLEDDAAATREIVRVLRPGGTALIAVPAGMDLWSAHDDEVGHVRRYDRHGLQQVLSEGGLVVDDLRSWNVLLRPIVKLRRRKSTGNDLERMNPVVNGALSAIIATERVLPVGGLPGVSLVARARRP